jgi:class 3 adenylate cyclase
MAATNVQALVLIYDIRGFTAASKRVGTADLGAFATAAHREILDLFSSRPPTFVKNLGDGHLLVWESPGGLTPELLDPVMAAARKAQTAFAAFVAGQGALGARLPKQVGIGVAFGETFRSDDYYGVAMNLAARLQNEARPEGLALSESVFEAVARRDERLREEFRRARVHLKGLGSTLMWVKRPFSWRRVLRPFVPWASAAALFLALVALADAGLRLPLSEPVRRFLDARSLSVFRAPRADAEVRAAARELRGRYVAFFDGVRDERGWIRYAVSPHEEREVDVWSSCQALCAILRAPETTPERLRRALGDLAAPFGPHTRFVETGGLLWGWSRHEGQDQPQAEPVLWTMAAISAALARPGLVDAAERPLWLRRLARAQRAAELYHPLGDGGWNGFPRQQDLKHHSPYVTALALLALLEMRSAGLPWHDGGPEEVAALLRSAAEWLVSRFDAKAPLPGWRRTGHVDDELSPGLTLQVYAELLRAESEAGVALPPALLAAIPRHLEDLAGKGLKDAYDAGENVAFYQTPRDHEESARTGTPVWTRGVESVNFLWHPWGIDACVRWLDRAGRVPGADPVDVHRVRHALGHLVVDLGEDAYRQATSGYVFVASETLYGLSSIPLP